ncbi:MAG: DUF1304 domain-containing protein [Phocaeicola sp.]
MNLFVLFLVGLVIIQHLVIMFVEIFAWESIGSKLFLSLPRSLFRPTRVMAANQGIYNGILVAGLLWSLFIDDPLWQLYVSIFFLSSVVLVALFGAVTVGIRIFLMQGVPALIALLALLLL